MAVPTKAVADRRKEVASPWRAEKHSTSMSESQRGRGSGSTFSSHVEGSTQKDRVADGNLP